MSEPPQPWGQPPYGAPPGSPYTPPPGWGPLPQSGPDGMAKAALVFGIFPMLGGLLGIGLGIGALARIRRSGRPGRGRAIAGIVLGSLWLVFIAFAVLVGFDKPHRDRTGALTSSGTVSLSELRPGDCTPERTSGAHITSMHVVPCTRPHATEAFSTFTMPNGAYPGDDEVRRIVNERCQRELPAYVGAPAGETGYAIVYLRPTRDSWRRGRRYAVCFLHDPAYAPLTGSARGAGPHG